MPKTVLLLLFFISLLALHSGCQSVSDTEPSSLPQYTSNPSWLLGFNTPWNEFGRDFGNGIDNTRFWNKAYSEAAEMGLNAMRVWVHCDGRGSPHWNLDTGEPTKLPPGFEEDFQEMLDLAQRFGIAVMPCLWSFDLVVDRVAEEGPYAGVHERFVTEPKLVKSYIDNILIPLVKRFDDHPALYAWEICNEPEWMVEDHGLDKEAVIRFIGLQAAALQRIAQKPVTNGAASIKFNAEPPFGEDNWWSDASLQAATGDPDASLDFYQIHAYGWMMPQGFEPYSRSYDEIGFDKPVMIGEAPAIGMTPPENSDLKPISASEMISLARKNGYFGHFFWSFSGHDGVGGRKEIRNATAKAAREDPSILPR